MHRFILIWEMLIANWEMARKLTRHYNRALEIDPGNAEALYRLGLLFVSQNNPEEYLKYFYQATSKDPDYGPAWYALYYYFYFRDPNKAIDYLQHYIASSDKSPENNYRMTDLLYLSKQYAAALKNAMGLLENKDSTDDSRLYKLIAYSYNGLKDSVNALHYMRIYFDKGAGYIIYFKRYGNNGGPVFAVSGEI